ncbi:MAG: DUF2946 family protein [Herminiimonas sp.]|nr:DUF2946 family protein [Herminiimonas sp.]
MDEIVRKAMAKWPNVPHCYGWLLLDARGHWRMRTEAAQAAAEPGDKIAHTALLAFINRNYTHDAEGRWYFQNGPQRVYVNLESTPFVIHTDGENAFVLQTGEPLGAIDGAWFTDQGQLILQSADTVAKVDDRDLVNCLPMLRMDAAVVDDAQLLKWIEGASGQTLTLVRNTATIEVGRIKTEAVADHFHFVRLPQPDATTGGV